MGNVQSRTYNVGHLSNPVQYSTLGHLGRYNGLITAIVSASLRGQGFLSIGNGHRLGRQIIPIGQRYQATGNLLQVGFRGIAVRMCGRLLTPCGPLRTVLVFR